MAVQSHLVAFERAISLADEVEKSIRNRVSGRLLALRPPWKCSRAELDAYLQKQFMGTSARGAALDAMILNVLAGAANWPISETPPPPERTYPLVSQAERRGGPHYADERRSWERDIPSDDLSHGQSHRDGVLTRLLKR